MLLLSPSRTITSSSTMNTLYIFFSGDIDVSGHGERDACAFSVFALDAERSRCIIIQVKTLVYIIETVHIFEIFGIGIFTELSCHFIKTFRSEADAVVFNRE